MKKYLIFLALILPLVFFQNCERMSFTNLYVAQDSSSKSDNNGTGYGGKLAGNYYRFHPQFTCENKEAPVSSITATPDAILYAENKQLQCGAINETLSASLIDSSIYQNDIIGYKDGIFESLQSTPQSIPANLVEVWCRDSKDAKAIETITHYNRQTLSADTEIYYMQGATVMTQTLTVSRIASAKKVTVKDGKDFLLEIFRDQPASEFGLFNAAIEVVLDGQKVKRPTLCRLGGSFDSKIWPATQIIDNGVQGFKVASDLSYFGYTSNTGATHPRLFSADIGGTNHLRVSPDMLTRGVVNFEIAPDLSNLLFWGDPRMAGGIELFKVMRNGTSLSQLNELISSPALGRATEIKFAPDGNSVLYRDGQQESANPSDVEMWLRAVPLSGGAPTIINPPLPLGGDFEIYDFAISKSFNKVAYLSGGISPQLLVSDLNGANTKQILSNPTASGFSIDFWETVHLPDPGNYIFIKTVNRQSIPVYSTMAIAVDGSNSFSFPQNFLVTSLSPSGNDVLLYNVNNNGIRKLTNLQTGRSFDLPPMNLPFFSKDSTALIGAKKLANGLLQATSISLALGTESEICPQASGSDMQIWEIGANEFIIAATDSVTQITSFYLKSSIGACQKKNSIPNASAKLNELVISPDLQKILLKTVSVVGAKNHDDLYYVPLNGQAPLVVNTAVYFGAQVSSFLFLKDSQTVLYLGDQLTPGSTNVFKWTAP